MAPAAPRQCPISDLVELMCGKFSGVRPRAAAQFLISSGSAKVAVRWPLMASTSSDAIPASRTAAWTQRLTPSGFGAVIDPPVAMPPAIDGPAEDLRVNPGAPLQGGFQVLQDQNRSARAGDETVRARAHGTGSDFGLIVVFPRDDAHGVKTGPDIGRRPLRSPPPECAWPTPCGSATSLQKSPRFPCCRRTSWRWPGFPGPAAPRSGREVPLPITCSTIRLPRRRTFPSLTSGTTVLGDRIHAADSRTDDHAGVPVDFLPFRHRQTRHLSRHPSPRPTRIRYCRSWT